MIKLSASFAIHSALALSAACGAGDGGESEIGPLLTTTQQIALKPVGQGSVLGTLTLAPIAPEGADSAAPTELTAELEIEGLDPGFVYPAHLREGSCGSDRGVLAQLLSLTPDEDGRAISRTPVEVVSISRARGLFVQVQGPGQQPVACGDL